LHFPIQPLPYGIHAIALIRHRSRSFLDDSGDNGKYHFFGPGDPGNNMKLRQLGESTLQVSEVCLGTMTFGVQNNEAESHSQLDYAFSAGVNFIDTAEMYAVPPTAETYGRTEQSSVTGCSGRHVTKWLWPPRPPGRAVPCAGFVAGRRRLTAPICAVPWTDH
jgi:hypothetical protein